MNVLSTRQIAITFPWDQNYKTRDILVSELILFGTDTINYYINHWPSKWGGHMETDRSRFHVAKTLHDDVKKTKGKNVLIMGDFNDRPSDKSVKEGLNAKTDTVGLMNSDLYNTSSALQKQNIGSHKYQNEWSLIDQVVISYNLINGSQSLQVKTKQSAVYKPDFLLVRDEKYQGEKPNRTYTGMRHSGGYSDHLPIYIDLIKK